MSGRKCKMDYLTVRKAVWMSCGSHVENCSGVETKRGRVIRERWSRDAKWRLSSNVSLPWVVG